MAPVIRGNSLYTIVPGPSWTQAEANAVKLGGHLVTINDSSENSYITTNLRQIIVDAYGVNGEKTSIGEWINHPFIGFSDNSEEGKWAWSSGETSSYTNWSIGEPNNGNTNGEDYASIYLIGEIFADSSLGKWNDSSGGGQIRIAETPFIRRGDSAYVIVQGPTWEEAEANAVKLGGHLVTINDAEENEWITKSFGVRGTSYKAEAWKLWIGLKNENSQEGLAWVSGERLEYTFFHQGTGKYDNQYAYINVPDNSVLYLGNTGVWVPYGNYGEATIGLAEIKLAPNIAPTETPSITGTSKVGSTISIDATTVKDADNFTGYTPTYNYSFEVSSDNGVTWTKLTSSDASDNNSNYTLTTAEVGKQVRGVVSYLDGYGTREIIPSRSIVNEGAEPQIDPTPPSVNKVNLTYDQSNNRFIVTVATSEPGLDIDGYIEIKSTTSPSNIKQAYIAKQTTPGIFTSYFQLNDSSPKGEWKVDRISVWDKGGNLTNLMNLSATGVPATVEGSLINPGTALSDSTPPSVNKVNLTYDQSNNRFIVTVATSEPGLDIDGYIEIKSTTSPSNIKQAYIAKQTTPGIFTSYFQLNDSSPKGEWKVDRISVWDKGGNLTNLMNLSATGVPATVEGSLINPGTALSDSTPPSVNKVNLTYDQSNNRFIVTVATSEPGLDIDGYIEIKSTTSPSNIKQAYIAKQTTPGIFTSYFQLNDSSPKGEWKVDRISVWDKGGNLTNLMNLASAGVPAEVEGKLLFPDKSAVNSNPSYINFSASSFDENLTPGSIVALLSTSDPDPNNTFSYQLISGTGSTDNAAFTITGDQLLIKSSPDFETKSSYSIRVRSTDQGGLSVDRAFSFSVNDLPEQPAFSISSVLDSTDLGDDFSADGTFGLYRIAGLPNRPGSVLAITDAYLEEGAALDASTLNQQPLPLLAASGSLFPSTAVPIAIRKDGKNIELLYQPKSTLASYQTQDFSLVTGKAVGAVTPAVKSLQSFELSYDQDLNDDGVIGFALTVDAVYDAADQGNDGDGLGDYGLYSINGINGSAAAAIAISDPHLEEGSTLQQSDLSRLLPLLTAAGKALPTAWTPLAIRQDGKNIELLYQPSSRVTSYQAQDFSLTTGKAIGAPTPAVKNIQSFEVSYDEDLNGDGDIGYTITVQSVLDGSDVGDDGSALGTYGLYLLSGLNGSAANSLVLSNADLEEGQVLRQADLTTLLPLLSSAGKALPSGWIVLGIRQDGTNIEVLYKPKSTIASYQTQDFSLVTGKAVGAPSALFTNLVPLELPYDQDLNGDGFIGLNFTEIGTTNPVAGSAAKDRLTITSLDIAYAGAADDTFMIGSDFQTYDPITMIGGSGNDTYTIKAGAFAVIYDLGTTKDSRDAVTGLPGAAAEWELYKVETTDYALYHATTDTFVVMVDPLGKEAAGNRIETIRFSKGAAQSISTLSTGATSILSGELLSYADLADRFGKDLAFAYGISSDAGPVSLKSTIADNLALVI